MQSQSATPDKMKNTKPPMGSAATTVEQNIQRASLIKLGVDAHADHYQIVRQTDNGPLQPPQRMKPEKFFMWAQKQKALADRVVVCYEAGTFGFHPARQLESCGVECLVMVPIKLNEGNTRVDNDRLDARRIAVRLDRYLSGDQDALNIVRIPTPLEEEQRDLGRQRQTVVGDIKRFADRGRSYLRKYGYRVKGRWWEGGRWKELKATLSPVMVAYLQRWVDILVNLNQVLVEIHTALIVQAEAHLQGRALPFGMGLLSYELLRLEVCDWKRFNNRRQVGSLSGLCASESSSGRNRQQGSVTKHGNPLMRWVLVEMAWRMVRFQSKCHAVAGWFQELLDAPTSAKRKRIIVAIARQLAVDLWRVATGQTTFEKLNFHMPAAKSVAANANV
jgi:transposase